MNICAGFDVGGTNARVHLFDEALAPLGGARRRIRDASAPDELAQVLVELLVEACEQYDLEVGALDAMGLGLAGQLDRPGRIVKNAPNLGWRDVDFVSIFEAELTDHLDAPPPIHLVNDLSAQVWGEFRAGAVEGVQEVLAIYVGTGIGGAILTEGRLVLGAGNNAGEIGHSKVVVGGRPCGCGERGCIEAYAGGVHLERQVAPFIDGGNDDEEPLLGRADQLSASHDEIAAIWEEATDLLAIVAANACTLLNPSALLIGGGVLENCDRFRTLFIQKTLPLILEVARDDITVEMAALSDLGGMLGAADLARTKYSP